MINFFGGSLLLLDKPLNQRGIDLLSLIATEWERRGYAPNDSFLKAIKFFNENVLREGVDDLLIHTQVDIIDNPEPKIFPFFKEDTLDTVTTRFLKLFPVEMKMAALEISDLYDPKGFTQSRVLRCASNIPWFLRLVLKKLDNNFFGYEARIIGTDPFTGADVFENVDFERNQKLVRTNMKRLASIFAKLFPGKL